MDNRCMEQIMEIIDDVVRTCLFKLFSSGIAVGNGAGFAAGTRAHKNINGHITYHESFRCIDVHRAEGLQHGLWIGLVLSHAISALEIEATRSSMG